MALGRKVDLLALEARSIELIVVSLRALLAQVELLGRGEEAAALVVHQVVRQTDNYERYVVVARF